MGSKTSQGVGLFIDARPFALAKAIVVGEQRVSE